MLLYQNLAFTKHEKNTKKSYKNNKFKMSTLTWSKEFELPNIVYQIFNTILSISSKRMRQLLIILQ